jgi:NAD(P)-dependent dehydrogenase (short-subunit alcohol dehydrogenase family)
MRTLASSVVSVAFRLRELSRSHPRRSDCQTESRGTVAAMAGGEPAIGERFAGANVLVTGAGRGIGAAIATRFVAEGATVALVDHDAERVSATADGLGSAALPVVVDLRDAAATTEVLAAVVDELGGVGVLVNNAGIFAKVPLLELRVDQWDEMFAVNLRPMLLTIQAVAAGMVAAGVGRIVNMASMAAKVGTPGEAHYAATKAGVVALTRVAAMELGPAGITVNAVCPGYVLTDMGATTRSDEQVAAWCAKTPLGRLQTVEEVAAVVCWLASAEASSCTGQAINVTGGMVMH